MAKLHNYHVLCPLIDQKSFLGVSQDKDDGFVLVTLGRNVVNKYRVRYDKYYIIIITRIKLIPLLKNKL